MLKSLYLIIKKSFKTKIQLLLELAMLAKQLEIYQRTDPKLKIHRIDRMFLSLIMDLFSNWKARMFIVKPETVIKWHRTAFRIFWRWKSQHKGGRPKISNEVIALIKQIANENPQWGVPRIHGEL
jgi:putative transposase